MQIDGIYSKDQINESKPPKAKKTKFESHVIADNKAIPQEPQPDSQKNFFKLKCNFGTKEEITNEIAYLICT